MRYLKNWNYKRAEVRGKHTACGDTANAEGDELKRENRRNKYGRK